jgi:predicted DNA-binding transcriptional regulator
METPSPSPSSNGRPAKAAGRGEPKGRPAGTRRTAAGRFKTLNAFLDFTAKDLSRAELLVWLMLFRDCRDGIARTGQADLAKRCGINRRTVYRAILTLRKRGLLSIVRRGWLGGQASTYRLRWMTSEG